MIFWSPRPTVSISRPRCAWARYDRFVVTVLAMLVTVGILVSRGWAQGPGTLPPPELLQQREPWPEQLEGIRPDAFLFQDESDTPVVMPRMSFEEIDRLRKLDRGVRSGDRVTTLERLSIEGSAEPLRAQWSVEMVVRLEPAAVREITDKSILVDLGLAGAHLLGAADVRITTAEAVDVESNGGESPGDTVAGAYVRLPQSERASGGRVGTAAETPARKAPPTESMPVRSPSPELSALPPGFPAFLQQATGSVDDEGRRGDSGYQLVLPVESVLNASASPRKPPLVIVKMEMSSRVWAQQPRQFWLPFELPSVPTSLRMELNPSKQADARGNLSGVNVVGSGREVVRREDDSNRFIIECDGGLIALNWVTAPHSSIDAGKLIEVESETQLQWESPSEPPSMEVVLQTRNLRGPLRECQIRLPPDSVLISPPEVTSSAPEPRVEFDGESGGDDASGSLWEISVSQSDKDADAASPSPVSSESTNAATVSEKAAAEDQQTEVFVRWAGGQESPVPSEIQVRLQLRQVIPDASAGAPWILRVPQVAGAIGHRGQVTIHTAGDHRLRWRPRLGIDAIVRQQANEQNGDLVYPFRFTQTRFELPVWLTGKQQQVRLAVEAELQVTRRAARVELHVQSSGGGIDPKGLQLQLGAWRLLGITSDRDDSKIEVNTSEGRVEWQVDSSDGKWPEKYEITAELLASASTEHFHSLSLPQLVSSDATTVLSDVQLSILDGRRESWLVDLAQSPALQRIAGRSDGRFRILSPEAPWSLSGSFASLPLHLRCSGEVTVSQAADRWATRSQWSISSPLDLEGRLRFSLPVLGEEGNEPLSTPGNPSEIETDPTSESEQTASVEEKTGEEETPASEEGSSSEAGHPGDSAPSDDSVAASAGQWTAMVDGGPAIVRDLGTSPDSEFAERRNFEIISPSLDSGTHRIELVFQQRIVTPQEQPDDDSQAGTSVQREEIASLLRLPTPVADQVELTSPLRVEMPAGATDSSGLFWRISPELDGVLGNLREAGRFQWASAGGVLSNSADLPEKGSHQWEFKVMPDFPIPLTLRSRLGEEKLTEIPRSFLRSLVGKKFRHEHLMASVRGGRRIRLGLPPRVQTIRVEVRLDGKEITSTRDAMGLRIDLPDPNAAAPQTRFARGPEGGEDESESDPAAVTADSPADPQSVHLLDVRIWTEEPNNPWWSRSEPLIRLPVGSGLQYWQLVVPTDSHLFWASSQAGRAMRWQREQLKLSRVPAISDAALIRWALDLDWQFGDRTANQLAAGALAGRSDAESGSPGEGNDAGETDSAAGEDNEPGGLSQEAIRRMAIRESLSNSTFTVPGNRYLFFAGNVFSFSALTVSRTVLWLAVGGLVLLLASAFQWLPSLNHPLVAFILAIAIAGLLVIAPDGVVLSAQLVLISMTLVAVFYAISAVVVPDRNQRALQPHSSSRDSNVSRGGLHRGSSELARPDRPSRQEAGGGNAETQEFDPRYTPAGSHSHAAAGNETSPLPDATSLPSTSPASPHAHQSDEDSASPSGVLDASGPDSSEALR